MALKSAPSNGTTVAKPSKGATKKGWGKGGTGTGPKLRSGKK
jgi:hypothetical protein